MIQAPKGTFDVLPEEAARREQIEAQIRRTLGAAGYGRIETPAFEATELFTRGVGEATDIVQKEMYTFDDGGGRSLTLRPEGTAPVCRAYIEHGMHKLPQPVKLWYLSSFFRAETPQRGRYREFWQVGAEAIGSPTPETDAELIVLLADLLDALGVRGLTLKLSSLGNPETRAEYREELKAYLRAHESGLSPEVVGRIDLNPMRAFDATDRTTRETMKGAPKLLDRLAPEDAEHFAEVRSLLDGAGVRYELDPTLVRGLDYYTRTLFEFTSEALGGAVRRWRRRPLRPTDRAAGRSADAGVGWAAGIERIMLASEQHPPAPELVDLFVALPGREGVQSAFELTNQARRAGLQAQLELAGRSLKGQLRHADRLGARYVAIVGENGQASLRNMQSGEQLETELQNVIPTILRSSRL